MAAVAAMVTTLPPPRRLALRQLRDHRNGQTIDTAMVVAFPGPATATGEDIVELHLHGGIAVVNDTLEVLTAYPDVRLAEAGEFTRRAFSTGRLDLSQVEGLADLIAAETSTQRAQALALTGGGLSALADQWRSTIIDALAQAEAGLDFAEDEADVAERIAEASTEQLATIAAALAGLLVDADRAARIRDGLTIVVSGAPNVGKSSLVNELTMRSAAIVTAIAGTTRDPVEVPIVLDGVAAVIIDTAGLRDTADPVEAEGINRARARAASADLVLRVGDYEAVPVGTGGWAIGNKADLQSERPVWADFYVSARTGQGIADLRLALAKWARGVVRPGEPALIANARHRGAFTDAAEAVRAASATDDMVLRAEELRSAAHALGRVAGRVGVDDILDRIFSQFCVGK